MFQFELKNLKTKAKWLNNPTLRLQILGHSIKTLLIKQKRTPGK